MPHMNALDRPIHVWMVGLTLIALWSGCILASLFWDLRQWQLSSHPQADSGVSTAVPIDLLALERRHRTDSLLQHALICLLGVAGIGLGSSRLQKQVDRRRRGEQALRRSEERFRSIFTHAGTGMATIDEKGRFIHVNAALCELLGYPEEKLLALMVDQLTHPKDLPLTSRMFEEVRAGQRQRYRYEKRYLREDGSTVWVDVSTAWFQYGDGPTYGIALFQDISDRMRATAVARENEERLQYLADHDALTHLPNRRFLQHRLDHALAKARREKGQVAVLFVDLDRFKTINDSLGHEWGDRLICAIAVLLRAMLRETDTLARFGGDEFIIVLERISEASDAGRVAQKILKELEHPVTLGEHRLHVSASIGISLFPGDGQDSRTLIQSADLAMYWAKEKGRNNSQFCTPELNSRTRDRLLLENALRSALENRELMIHYQPQVDLASGRVVGMEALLRWQHPIRGLVPTDDFIPLAEETGVIIHIGEWVLRTACRQARHWIEQGFPPLRIAVNISARQFREENLASAIENILRETGLAPQMLELELTENMMMTEVERAISIMESLTRLGVRLAIDDFGAGYSSLSYLRRFPIATLKIDRSFVQSVTESARTAALTDSVVHLARRMDLEVVAEGIETEEQRDVLMQQRCHLGQGYFFGYPRPAEEIEPLLSAALTNGRGSEIRPRQAV